MELITRSKIGLVFLSLCCIGLIWSAVPKGIASLYKLGLDNRVEGESLSFDTITSLKKELLYFDNNDPENLISAGYADLKQGMYKPESNNEYFENAREMTIKAIALRPLDSKSYARLAYIDTYLGRDFSEIREHLNKAQKTGYYKPYTAWAGLDIYFSHWRSLERKEKVLAFNYLTNHRKFGLSIYDINTFVSSHANHNVFCRIDQVIQLKLKTCR